MPTPSEANTRGDDLSPAIGAVDLTAHSHRRPRSVFGNYLSGGERDPQDGPLSEPHAVQKLASPIDHEPAGLQAGIDAAMARSFAYQLLARAFEDPSSVSWSWLVFANTHNALFAAVGALAGCAADLTEAEAALNKQLANADLESFRTAYVTAFGHAARGDCPLNEIEYGDLKADPLFQPHRLADLAAFYRAFDLEVAPIAAERPDHICMQLEFMSFLTAKEAYGREHQMDHETIALCRDAQKKFLREHLGRWSPAFARRLARVATDPALAAVAEFTRRFISAECAQFQLLAGSEDLLLRPVDEAAESLCASCGLKDGPPGASHGGPTI